MLKQRSTQLLSKRGFGGHLVQIPVPRQEKLYPKCTGIVSFFFSFFFSLFCCFCCYIFTLPLLEIFCYFYNFPIVLSFSFPSEDLNVFSALVSIQQLEMFQKVVINKSLKFCISLHFLLSTLLCIFRHSTKSF